MIYLFLADGFEEIEALTPVDMLRRAGLEVKTVGVGGDVIRGAHGIKVVADMRDRDFDDKAPDMVILPGGMPGSRNLDASPVVDRALKAADKCGAYICAICAAPFVLGKRGLLKGFRATCYPGFEKDLEGAIVEGTTQERRVVVDGRRITAAGMGCAEDFGAELITALKDRATADKILSGIIAR